MPRARRSVCNRMQNLTPTPESSSSELQLARGYAKLCALDKQISPRFVPLVAVGDHEIRMVALADHTDPKTLFWLELFDARSERAVDSYRSHNIKDAIPIFEHFVAQAEQAGAGD